MKRLITLIRHAKSDWSHPELSDFDRPLNTRGTRDAPFMGARLAEKLDKLDARFDLMLASPANRAITTARVVADAIHYPPDKIEVDPDLYLASATELLNTVQSVDDDIHHIALVSHNPGLTTLVNSLGSRHILNLPTCGIAILETEIDSWRSLEPGTFKTLSFLYPKMY
jgi:phosphohistidine phosphatase